MVAIVAAAPGCLAAILGFMNNMMARRNAIGLAANSVHVQETRDAMATLEHNTNSIKDALIKVTGEAEFQKGLKQGSENRE